MQASKWGWLHPRGTHGGFRDAVCSVIVLLHLDFGLVVRAEDFTYDFRGGGFDERLFYYEGPAAQEFVKPEPQGLTWRYPPGKRPKAPVGIYWQSQVRGDFTATARFEIIDIDRPKWGFGLGPELYLILATPAKDGLSLTHMLTPQPSPPPAAPGVPALPDAAVPPPFTVLHYSHRTTDAANKRVTNEAKSVSLAEDNRKGRLRLRREGATLIASFSRGDAQEFTEIHRTLINKADIRMVRFAAIPGNDPGANFHMRLLDFQLQGPDVAPHGHFASAPPPDNEVLPPLNPALQNAAPVELPAGDPKPVARRYWFLLGACIVGGLLLIVGLVVLRRKALAKPLAGAPSAAERTIRVACTRCGRKLRAKDEFAGKRVNCPSCGDVVQIPATTS
jgi:hypothetical protein